MNGRRPLAFAWLLLIFLHLKWVHAYVVCDGFDEQEGCTLCVAANTVDYINVLVLNSEPEGVYCFQAGTFTSPGEDMLTVLSGVEVTLVGVSGKTVLDMSSLHSLFIDVAGTVHIKNLVIESVTLANRNFIEVRGGGTLSLVGVALTGVIVQDDFSQVLRFNDGGNFIAEQCSFSNMALTSNGILTAIESTFEGTINSSFFSAITCGSNCIARLFSTYLITSLTIEDSYFEGITATDSVYVVGFAALVSQSSPATSTLSLIGVTVSGCSSLPVFFSCNSGPSLFIEGSLFVWNSAGFGIVYIGSELGSLSIESSTFYQTEGTAALVNVVAAASVLFRDVFVASTYQIYSSGLYIAPAFENSAACDVNVLVDYSGLIQDPDCSTACSGYGAFTIEPPSCLNLNASNCLESCFLDTPYTLTSSWSDSLPSSLVTASDEDDERGPLSSSNLRWLPYVVAAAGVVCCGGLITVAYLVVRRRDSSAEPAKGESGGVRSLSIDQTSAGVVPVAPVTALGSMDDQNVTTLSRKSTGGRASGKADSVGSGWDESESGVATAVSVTQLQSSAVSEKPGGWIPEGHHHPSSQSAAANGGAGGGRGGTRPVIKVSRHLPGLDETNVGSRRKVLVSMSVSPTEAPNFDSTTRLKEACAQPKGRVNIEVDTSMAVLKIDDPNVVQVAYVGAGMFGAVYHFDWNHASVAVKVLSKVTQTSVQDFVEEAQMLATLRCEHIVAYVGLCVAPLAIVTEYMAGGDLAQYLKSVMEGKRPLDYSHHCTLTLDILRGLVYIHSRGVAHRDLKPANVLLTANYKAKIADFGLAGTKERDLSGAGTPRYAAPEVLAGKEGDLPADMYGYGCIFFETLTLVKPFANLKSIEERQTKTPADLGGPSWAFSAHDVELKRLLGSLWSFVPSERATADATLATLLPLIG